MTAQPLKRGRPQALAKFREIAERWRDDSDPDKRFLAKKLADLVTADASDSGSKRHGRIVRALGLSGRADRTLSDRIRTAVAGIKSEVAQREAFRREFPAFRDDTDAEANSRIRAALK